MSIFKLDNVIQNYVWGSRTSINELFDIPNPDNLPQAEIWMGSHPSGCSRNATSGELLSDIIKRDKAGILGELVANKYGDLPYLFKVLSAETPLSIQVHPNKHKSELGFTRENKLGIELDAPNRNYKDPNHKPELVFALTPYKAMNGFRPTEHIVELFNALNLPSLKDAVNILESNKQDLQYFFSTIMKLKGALKANVLQELANVSVTKLKSPMLSEAFNYSKEFSRYYPEDIGLLAPFILNTIELAPGEAMFLFAETPHSYVQGTALEVMASSDNVLRAGLTPKHIDVNELLDNVIFEPTDPQNLRMPPSIKQSSLMFSTPVDDFNFEVMTLLGGENRQVVLSSAEIVFCIQGRVKISNSISEVSLKRGESAFIGCDSLEYKVSGIGELARVYC